MTETIYLHLRVRHTPTVCELVRFMRQVPQNGSVLVFPEFTPDRYEVTNVEHILSVNGLSEEIHVYATSPLEPPSSSRW